jgi:beta-glucosidase
MQTENPVPGLSDATLRDLVGALSLAEKATLCSGASMWHTAAMPSIGLDRIAMSDGPAGIRGTATEIAELRIASGEELSISFPAPSALAATWDTELATEFGRALGSEAVRERADVVLAPVVNLQRTAIAGRHFECFSEDPLLTGTLARAVVDGIQDCGVAACVKHFVGNETETRRTTSVSRIDERTLREVYLAPFELTMRDGGAWAAMSAYNQVDLHGVAAKAVAHPWLLDELIRREWAYDGLLVSDWSAAAETESTARHGLDLVMPGPDTVWSDGRLVDAVRRGTVPESALDEKVFHLLRLASRVGALRDTRRGTASVSRGEARSLSRVIASRSMVVLRNTGDRLPVPLEPRTVALIGPNAAEPYLQGGGSASIPLRAVQTLEGALGTAWPGTTISTHEGARSRVNPPMLDALAMRDPETAAPGVRLEFLDEQGNVVGSAPAPDWPGVIRGLSREVHDVRVRAIVPLVEPGEHWLGAAVVGSHRVLIDGAEVARSDQRVGEETVLDSSANNPRAIGRSIQIELPREITVEITTQKVDAGGLGVFARASIHQRVPGPSPDALITAAVQSARASDLVVVIVGTNEDVESEGWDRANLELPGTQNELVEAVLAVRPDAIIVVNAGAPVELPWLHRASIVLWAWLPGQEFAGALAAVLTGTTEPSGRLPWTLPALQRDAPVPTGIPDASDLVDYAEGIDVGYRAWLRSGAKPLLPFGHGLGWTTWLYSAARTGNWSADGLEVHCTVENIGARAGREVVQVYLESDSAAPIRPVRWLGGYGTTDAEAGETREVRVQIPRRAFEVWDGANGRWMLPPGEYRILIGRSIDDIRQVLTWSAPDAREATGNAPEFVGPPTSLSNESSP